MARLPGRELLRRGYLPMARLGRARRKGTSTGRPGHSRYVLSVMVDRDKVGEVEVDLLTYGDGNLSLSATLRKEGARAAD